MAEVEEFLADVTAFGVRHGWSDTRIGEEYGNRAIIHRARKGYPIRRSSMLRVRQFMHAHNMSSPQEDMTLREILPHPDVLEAAIAKATKE